MDGNRHHPSDDWSGVRRHVSLRRPRIVACGVGLLLAIVVAGAWSGAASAHVTLEDDQAPAGGFTTLHFQVPNEEDEANTVKVEIGLPRDVTIASVIPRTTPGWTVTTETRKLDKPARTDDGQVDEVVSKVTFSGGSIPPGQFQAFDLDVGPLPDTVGATIAFPAVQTYDDGTTVRWIDPLQPGQPEPDHPAPTITLTAASASGDDGGGHDGLAVGLAVAALVAGVAGTVTGVAALVLSRRRS